MNQETWDSLSPKSQQVLDDLRPEMIERLRRSEIEESELNAGNAGNAESAGNAETPTAHPWLIPPPFPMQSCNGSPKQRGIAFGLVAGGGFLG